MGWAPRTLNVTLPDKLRAIFPGASIACHLPLSRRRSDRAHTDRAFGACDGAHGTKAGVGVP